MSTERNSQVETRFRSLLNGFSDVHGRSPVDDDYVTVREQAEEEITDEEIQNSRDYIEEAQKIIKGDTILIGGIDHVVAQSELIDLLRDALSSTIPDLGDLWPRMVALANDRAHIARMKLELRELRDA